MVSSQDSNRVLNALECSPSFGRDLRAEAVRLLASLSGYDWSGIYVLDGAMLELDEFVGAPTEHKLIPFGLGVCGTAIAKNENQLVDDVSKLDNYLSCSVSTRSEIVVLIRRDGRILGQIDIDSHSVAAFDHSDEKFLERAAQILAARWE